MVKKTEELAVIVKPIRLDKSLMPSIVKSIEVAPVFPSKCHKEGPLLIQIPSSFNNHQIFSR